MARSGNAQLIGPIAVVIGGLLAMGGLMFLLVVLLSDLPRVIVIPPLVQIALGALGATAGVFLWRGHAKAKFVILLAAIGVVVNLVVTIGIFVNLVILASAIVSAIG